MQFIKHFFCCFRTFWVLMDHLSRSWMYVRPQVSRVCNWRHRAKIKAIATPRRPPNCLKIAARNIIRCSRLREATPCRWIETETFSPLAKTASKTTVTDWTVINNAAWTRMIPQQNKTTTTTTTATTPVLQVSKWLLKWKKDSWTFLDLKVSYLFNKDIY